MQPNKNKDEPYDKYISDSDDYPKYSDGLEQTQQSKPIEIIGDDYPTYEDIVNQYYEEQNKKKGKNKNEK